MVYPHYTASIKRGTQAAACRLMELIFQITSRRPSRCYASYPVVAQQPQHYIAPNTAPKAGNTWISPAPPSQPSLPPAARPNRSRRRTPAGHPLRPDAPPTPAPARPHAHVQGAPVHQPRGGARACMRRARAAHARARATIQADREIAFRRVCTKTTARGAGAPRARSRAARAIYYF